MPGPLAIASGIFTGAKILGGLLGGKKKSVGTLQPFQPYISEVLDPGMDNTEYHRRLLSAMELIRKRDAGGNY